MFVLLAKNMTGSFFFLCSCDRSRSRTSSDTPDPGQFQPTVLQIGNGNRTSPTRLSQSSRKDSSGQFAMEPTRRMSIVSSTSSDISDRLDRVNSPLNVPIGETGPRKVAPIIASLRTMQHGRTHSTSGVPLSFQKSPKRVTLTESGQLRSLSPAARVGARSMSKTRSDGNVVARTRTNKDDPINDSFNQINA